MLEDGFGWLRMQLTYEHRQSESVVTCCNAPPCMPLQAVLTQMPSHCSSNSPACTVMGQAEVSYKSQYTHYDTSMYAGCGMKVIGTLPKQCWLLAPWRLYSRERAGAG